MPARFSGNRMPVQKKIAFGANKFGQKKQNSLVSGELKGKMLEAQKKYGSSIKRRASSTRAIMEQAERENLAQRKKLREMIEVGLRQIELRGIKIEWLEEKIVGKARREQFLRNYSKELQNILNQLEIIQEVSSNPELLKRINLKVITSFNDLNIRDRQIVLTNPTLFVQELFQLTQNAYQKLNQP